MGKCFVLRLNRIWGRAVGLSNSLCVGYARVSTRRQNLALQLEALRGANCDTVYADRAKGTIARRRGLEKAIRKCRSGDRFVVWRLDRLSRKSVHLISTVEFLTERGVHVRVLNGRGTSADFEAPEGRFVLGVIASFTQLEHEVISVRTKHGVRHRSSSPPHAWALPWKPAKGWLLNQFRLPAERDRKLPTTISRS
ncbi:recombinase family protein [Rhizobium sp. P40RR-XXII]|uniref:recombinase family protein n=1 Tax=unclassified Rhizobium TaxID=2613769 RepID=UPI00145714F5|nr:recombinase family protein [Rhizobium sp. P28RR-XV]NLS20613.1 recombinase family protein [Rhizobium sp. P40RR-XXII]